MNRNECAIGATDYRVCCQGDPVTVLRESFGRSVRRSFGRGRGCDHTLAAQALATLLELRMRERRLGFARLATAALLGAGLRGCFLPQQGIVSVDEVAVVDGVDRLTEDSGRSRGRGHWSRHRQGHRKRPEAGGQWETEGERQGNTSEQELTHRDRAWRSVTDVNGHHASHSAQTTRARRHLPLRGSQHAMHRFIVSTPG